jgi:hypothetical protein
MKIVDRAAASQAIKDRKCFACGSEPTNGFGEHVIPRWLQRRIGLANRQLTLINGTRIPYRQLTVPCCQICNNGFLRRIENSVLDFTKSPIAPEPTTRFACGRWLAKILLGILVKESALLLDRQDPAKGPIVPAEFIEEFRHLRFILQSARKRTKFESLHSDHPFTLFLYKIKEDEDYENFDLTTNLLGQSIAIRFSGLGMIFVNDGGLQHEVGPKGPLNLEWRKLHPVQFSEVAAMVHYKATLRDATHSYMSIENPEELVIEQASVRPYSSDRFSDGAVKLFRDWSDLECAGFIERYRQVNWGPVFDPSTGMFQTTLRNKRGGLPSPKKFARRHA